MSSYFVLKVKSPLSEDAIERLSGDFQKKFNASFLGASELIPSQELTLHEAQPQWVKDYQGEKCIEFYFAEKDSIERAGHWFQIEFPQIQFDMRTEEDQDWNAKWRLHFKGLNIEPCWQIIPIWDESTRRETNRLAILMNPSLGFGTGEHGTTHLCLEAIGKWPGLENKRLLDFGSGSGILSVAAALRGATVRGIEIDELALQSSLELVDLNKVSSNVSLSQYLKDDDRDFDFVVANILRSTLLQFSQTLIDRLKVGGRLLISGLLHDQMQEVASHYESLWVSRFGRQPTIEFAKKDQWGSVQFGSA